ncbi:MAG: 4-phosphoerythronate dehydrogenase [Bacteroidales bacterium]
MRPVLLEGTPVRFIASATIGYDHIDTAWCDEAGIAWTNAPGCNSASVRQYVVSVLLALARSRRFVLKGKTLGVVGVGHVGSKVAAAAHMLGMHVLKNDPPRARKEGPEGYVDLATVLKDSDIVTLHVPLNRGGSDNTFHLAGREFLSSMKPGSILINSSRGPVVDGAALTDALAKEHLAAAVLDVFETEPDVPAGLLSALAYATPHIAGYSLDGKAKGTEMTVRALSRTFGLGLDQWSPVDLPLPGESMIHADISDGSQEEILWDIYRTTYDVGRDDRTLRDRPEAFEALRGNYPLRREPQAYTVRMFQAYREMVDILEHLGFSVLADSCM